MKDKRVQSSIAQLVYYKLNKNTNFILLPNRSMITVMLIMKHRNVLN